MFLRIDIEVNSLKLEKYKAMLLEARAAILHELAVEKEYFVYNEQGDVVDIADTQISNSVLNTLSDLDQEKLKDIELALEKIEDGSYGICEGTGRKIPQARLNHIPWTRYTTEYAQQIERSKN